MPRKHWQTMQSVILAPKTKAVKIICLEFFSVHLLEQLQHKSRSFNCSITQVVQIYLVRLVWSGNGVIYELLYPALWDMNCEI